MRRRPLRLLFFSGFFRFLGGGFLPLWLHGEELDLKPSQANPEEKALGVELRPAAQPYLPGEEQRQNDNGQDKQGLHVSSAGTSGGAADSSSTSAFRSRARLASSSMVIWLPSWD